MAAGQAQIRLFAAGTNTTATPARTTIAAEMTAAMITLLFFERPVRLVGLAPTSGGASSTPRITTQNRLSDGKTSRAGTMADRVVGTKAR
jgi:hypothetical protein